ncbi:MAG: family 20 glycosylhydrolase [Candidatus Omnitrophica bacterium]|nr:family 20 glycosylhydrolase [Candidatus Omnitrophota bacterium]
MPEKFFSRNKPAVGMRGIHLDLKGLPPTPARLLEILELLSQARINCVLVEWEDTYPWKTYPVLRSETAYSMATINKFLSKAEKLGIEIIPLVQSFGHLENVLSKRKFQHLREIPDNVSDICPLKKGSREIILDMVKDVLLTHKNIKYFHLGGDEVWSLGSCEKCKKFVEKNGKASLYLVHIEPIFEFLNASGIRPIIWDDMMRNWDKKELKKIAGHTDLMCWSYSKDTFTFVKKETMEKFKKAGCRMWAASAFKGGDGAYVDIPNIETRAMNMLNWVKYGQSMKMEGVIATGWSRYNTFVSPCEGIEASLHTLVLAGKIAWDRSIPQDPFQWANEFLKHCQNKGVRTGHFQNCHSVSENLQESRDAAYACFRNYLQQAHLAGEPERINPMRAKHARKALFESLKKVKEFAKAWERAHRTLVPNVWIRKYTLSRVEPVKKIKKVFFSKNSSG